MGMPVANVVTVVEFVHLAMVPLAHSTYSAWPSVVVSRTVPPALVACAGAALRSSPHQYRSTVAPATSWSGPTVDRNECPAETTTEPAGPTWDQKSLRVPAP